MKTQINPTITAGSNAIKYVIGDATHPVGGNTRIICHCCNDCGAWGAGFVLALSKRWSQPEAEYKNLTRMFNGCIPLGQIQFVTVGVGLFVANLVGQRGTALYNGVAPIRYDAIERGLKQLAKGASDIGATVHMPRIGCGLAGGHWGLVEEIINRTLIKAGVEVFVYDLPAKDGGAS